MSIRAADEVAARVAGAGVSVRRCPGGPLLVRGADHVIGEDGVPVPVTRPVVAVCVCEKSQRKPWCDGTHKLIPGFQ